MTAEQIIAICGVVTAIGGALAVVSQWVVKPLKGWWAGQMGELKKQDAQFTEAIGGIGKRLDSIEETLSRTGDDVADVLGDRLMQAHTHFMALGWCPAAEKQRFCDMHKRYAARGHNHLANSYEADLLALPEEPTRKGADQDE